MTPFARLLASLLLQYGGTKTQFAHAAGLSPSQLSRLLNPDRYAHGAPPLTTCLRIARVTRYDPSKLLDVAGYKEIADLIESLYGAPSKRSIEIALVSPVEELHLQQWRALTPAVQRALDLLIKMSTSERDRNEVMHGIRSRKAPRRKAG